jgi:O-antigen/teichoic acid export membrane protein
VIELSRAIAAPLAALRLASSTVLAAIFASIYLIGAARLLGPKEYSDLAVCLSLVYVAQLFLGPLYLTLIRFSAVYRNSNEDAQIRPLLRRTGRLYAPWVVAAIVVSIVFATPIAAALNVGNATLVPWMGVLVGLGFALGAVRATALGTNQHRVYSRSVLFDNIARLAAGGALVLIYPTAAAGLAGFLISTTAALLVFGAYVWRRLPVSARQWTEAADVMRFWARTLLFSAVVAGLQNVDMIVAKIRLDAGGAGDYAIALAIARGFLLVAGPFAAVALAGPTSEVRGSIWTRAMQAPVTTYAALSAAAVALLFVASAGILALLFGRQTAAQTQLMPLLGLTYAVAGVFLVLAQGEIRTGRFTFLVPVTATLAAALLIVWLVPATPAAIAWTMLGTQIVAVACVLLTPVLHPPKREPA